MIPLCDFLLNDDGSPRVGATVTGKLASILTPNPNPVIATAVTDANGRWTLSLPDGQTYDVFVQDGQQQLRYAGLSQIPQSFADAHIAVDANIAATKLDDGIPADIGDPAVFVTTTMQDRINQLIGLIGRMKTGANVGWLTVPAATIQVLWDKLNDATGHNHTAVGNNAPKISHLNLTTASIGGISHASLDTHYSSGQTVHGLAAGQYVAGFTTGAYRILNGTSAGAGETEASGGSPIEYYVDRTVNLAPAFTAGATQVVVTPRTANNCHITVLGLSLTQLVVRIQAPYLGHAKNVSFDYIAIGF